MTTMVLPQREFPLAEAGTLVPVQQPGTGDNGGQGEDFGKSSPVGLLVLLLFLVAVALLVRSMTKHLKRIPASFDNDNDDTDTGQDGPKSPDSPDPGTRSGRS